MVVQGVDQAMSAIEQQIILSDLVHKPLSRTVTPPQRLGGIHETGLFENPPVHSARRCLGRAAS